MKTDVILTANIVGLGAESDQVRVAAGYARNYLFPRGLAIPLTQANKRRLEALRKRRAEREAQEFNTMTELAKTLSKLICIIKVKTGEDGKMFGAVTAGMIAEELKHQFDLSLDKRKIHLEHPIKALGDYEVQLDLHAEVKGTLKVRVESTTPITAPAATAAPAEPKKEEPAAAPADKKARRAAKAAGEKAPAQADRPAEAKKEKSAKPGRAPKSSKAEKPAADQPRQ
ncbi:MAG: 50S ribosomal protein L9 [Verrucomicrobiae bacterium]|nr:50S ribosomal protein L9 [Verrucomicrobiae bacterium]